MTMGTWAWYSGVSHQPGSGLPQERLEVSSGHQFQQNEPGHGLQTDSYTTHNVLVAELTAGAETQQGKEKCIRNGFVGLVWQTEFCSPFFTLQHWVKHWNAICSPLMKDKLIFNGGVRRRSWGVWQTEERSCSIVWYGESLARWQKGEQIAAAVWVVFLYLLDSVQTSHRDHWCSLDGYQWCTGQF